MTRRLALVNENHTAVPAPFLVARNTGANSCATPIAGPTGARLPRQIRPHPIDLAVVLTEPHRRDLVVVGEPVHRPAERGADLVHNCRRGDRIAKMRGHKRRHLPAHLQIRHIAVQINPIHALQIQAYMPVEHIIHRNRGSHHHSLTTTLTPDQTPCSAVGGEASLVASASLTRESWRLRHTDTAPSSVNKDKLAVDGCRHAEATGQPITLGLGSAQ